MANLNLHSRINLYTTQFRPEDRFVFPDGFPIMTQVLVIFDFQFIKPAIDVTIKIPMARYMEEQPNSEWDYQKINYCTITNYLARSLEGDDVRTYNYFVNKVEIVDTGTIRLSLHMDCLNQLTRLYGDENIPWSERTHILREHRDRYKFNQGHDMLHKVVDFESEGVNVTKHLKSVEDVGVQEPWYLVYKSDYDSSKSEDNPMRLYLYPDEPTDVYVDNQYDAYEFDPSDLQGGKLYYIMPNGEPLDVIEASSSAPQLITSDTLALVMWRETNDKINVGWVKSNNGTEQFNHVTFEPGDLETPFRVNGLVVRSKSIVHVISGNGWGASVDNPTKYYPSYAIAHADFRWDLKIGSTTRTLDSISQLDRTDSKLVKIIRLPYCPFEKSMHGSAMEIPSGMKLVGNSLRMEIKDITGYSPLRAPITRDLKLHDELVNVIFPNRSQARGHDVDYDDVFKWEPKLLHSDFTLIKFAFDNFYYEIPLENFQFNSIPGQLQFSVDVDIIASCSVSSTFMFKITPSEPYYTLRNTVDYPGYMTVKRNNELPIFTSSYLNYIRNGYNFDVKQQNLSVTASTVQTVISLVGAVAAFASSTYTGGAGIAAGVGLVGSAIGGGVNLATKISSNEVSMASKLQQLQAQGVNVTGAEEIDLLNWYSPLLRKYVYQVNDVELMSWFNTMRLTGYKTDRYGIPHTHTRLYYDYLQCEMELRREAQDTLNMINEEIYTELKSLFAQGVTFIHENDLEQQYENYELSLLR